MTSLTRGSRAEIYNTPRRVNNFCSATQKAIHSKTTMAIFDVIIIGGGLSGLQAALDLHEAGRSVIILEARDRVGGKTRTIERPDGKGFQEFGAAWVNDTNQSHIWAYCRRFGLTPVVQNIIGSVASEDKQGNVHAFPFGGLPPVSTLLSM
jgi:monoamine oxidase